MIRTDFFLLQPKRSIAYDVMFSNTAMIVESAAKDINTKKSVPQILPPGIFANTLGSVMKIRLGPASCGTLYAKQDGITIIPAIKATSVSSAQILIASPGIERSLPR